MALIKAEVQAGPVSPGNHWHQLPVESRFAEALGIKPDALRDVQRLLHGGERGLSYGHHDTFVQ